MKKVILLIDDDTEDQEVFISQLKEYDPAINVVSRPLPENRELTCC